MILSDLLHKPYNASACAKSNDNRPLPDHTSAPPPSEPYFHRCTEQRLWPKWENERFLYKTIASSPLTAKHSKPTGIVCFSAENL